MTAKEWLRQCRRIEDEVKQLKEAKQRAYVLAVGSSVDTSKEKLSGTRKNSTENKFVAYTEYSELLDKKITELMSRRLKTRKMLDELDNPIHRMLLQYYYIDCLTWEQVADRIHYSIRSVHRLHGKALTELDRVR